MVGKERDGWWESRRLSGEGSGWVQSQTQVGEGRGVGGEKGN